MADWIVSRITWYKLHVEGVNLARGADRAERFSWSVPDVADPRYDLSNAVIDPEARPYLGRTEEV